MTDRGRDATALAQAIGTGAISAAAAMDTSIAAAERQAGLGAARLLTPASQREAIRPFPHRFPISGLPA